MADEASQDRDSPVFTAEMARRAVRVKDLPAALQNKIARSGAAGQKNGKREGAKDAKVRKGERV